MAGKKLNITELDFDQIKAAIKDYYKRSDITTFKDFDFEGSGLNHLLDILAYNTHYNAILAHLAANEGFIGSAQLRKNVVARAKTLGYVPRSNTSPQSVIYLTGPDIASLSSVPKNTKFSTTVGETSYDFVTLSAVTGNFADNAADRAKLTIREGTIKTARYTFDSSNLNNKYQIPDKNVDTSTLTVTTAPNTNTSSITTYTKFTELSNTTNTSNVYFLFENPDGFFEIEFGNDVIGKKPAAGSVVTIEYLVTKGAEANGANIFTLESTLGASLDISVDNTPAPTNASGGSGKESIESIRFSAPLSFTSQDRAVTVSDYVSVVKNNSPATIASVWGGEDNDPIDLGAVYISAAKGELDPANPTSNVLSDEEKASLKSVLQDKGVLTMRHEFVDPEFVSIYFTLDSKYDPNQTSLTQSGLESAIKNTISTFDINNLQRFNSVFRYSQFLKTIDDSNQAILSTAARVYAYKYLKWTDTLVAASAITIADAGDNRANLTAAQKEALVFDFTFALDTDETNIIYTEEGSSFNLGTDEAYFDVVLKEKNLYYLRIYSLDGNTKVYFDGSEYSENNTSAYFGILNTTRGTITFGKALNEDDSIIALPALSNATQASGASTGYKIYTRPAANDMVSKNRNVITIDEDESTITATIDTIALSGNSAAKNYTTLNRDTE